jgi:geranylgeranyl pyrophosphate synthase
MNKFLNKIENNNRSLISTIRYMYLNNLTCKKYSDIAKKNHDYNLLTPFEPEPEILKFYKNYLNYKNKNNTSNSYNNLTKEEYIKLYQNKLDIIDSKNINSNSISITKSIGKFLGMLEFKSQIGDILKIINEKIVTSEENHLQELSEYNFKQTGKMIRPYLLILISKYLYECKYNNESDYFNSQIHQNLVQPFSACVEVLHNASLLHDDIIDNSDQRRNYKTAHNVFGIRNTVFGANYIISRAANLIADLNLEHLNEIYSTMVFNLAYGECQQSLKNPEIEDVDNFFKIYMIKTYYKTASLLALGLRGIGIIYKFDLEMQRRLFNLGLHIGLIFQLTDDVMDVLYDSNKLQKPALKDLQEGVINSHILFEICDDENNSKGVLDMAKRKFKGHGDVNKIVEILKTGNGIIKTQNLALDHLIECYKILDDPFLKNNKTKADLFQCFQFLISRDY